MESKDSNPEVAALQSTIAQLRARVQDLESGSGEPVAWQYRVSAGPATGWSLWHDGKGDEFRNSYQVENRPRFAAPPAPVAVDERAEFVAWVRREWPQAPLSYVRDLLPKDDPRYGEFCDETLQRAWVGWQARACLDATAALNGVKS